MGARLNPTDPVARLHLRDSEMATRLRAHDWASTPLGPMSGWPDGLLLAVGICLNSRFPMFVAWGPELTFLYNDAYAPMLGQRHGRALGAPMRQLWSDIWATLEPQVRDVLDSGAATWNERVYLGTERNGYFEDTWFTWSYSPIPDGAGGIGGMFCAVTEETTHVLAERERERLAAQRQLALDSAQMGWWRVDPATWQVSWDDRFRQIVGVSDRERDLPGVIERSVHPDDRDRVGAAIAASVDPAVAAPFAMEYRIVRPDGDVRWVASEGIVVFVGEGAERRAGDFVGTLVDVTERKAAEQALAESAARVEQAVARQERDLAHLRAVLNNMVEGVVVADPDGNILDWNPAALALHGFASVEEARLPLAELDGPFELRALDGALLPFDQWPMSRLLRGETLEGIEVQVRRAGDPDARVFTYSGAPVTDGEGRIVLAVLTVHDITDRRTVERELADSEARFRDLANFMPLVVWTTRPDGAIDYLNDRWYEYTGLPRDGAPSVDAAVHPDDRGPMQEAWRRSLAEGVPFQLEYRLLGGSTGTWRWYLGRAVPVRDREGGDVVRWFGSASDVHEQVLARMYREELLGAERAARIESERVGRMKDEFLATLSHELRTPLNAILGWAQLIQRGRVGPAELPGGLAVIERNARAQAQLIEDMLDMSRIASGKLRLDVGLVSLAEVVADTLHAVAPAADAKRVRLIQDVDPAVGPVKGDVQRIQQVVWNLLSNAVKFTPAGGAVTVALRAAGETVEVSVTDTGQGIPAEFLPHVFERFQQADSRSTRQHGGLGLGLAIVRHLVEAHGGRVRATSPGAGLGSTFTVTLPLATAEDADPARPAESGPALPLNGLRVLVVDDEPDARELVRRILGDDGALVSVAGSAHEALELLRAERFGLLVSDIGMPDLDGYELIRRVREQDGRTARAVPAVALTAFARPEDREIALRAGYQAHVSKPVDAGALHAAAVRLTAAQG